MRRFVPFDILAFDILSYSMLFLFDNLSHSTLCPIRPLLLSTVCLFGVLSHSTFCLFDILSHSTFWHSAFCPIRRFVVRRFVLSAFVTSTFCRWTVCGIQWSLSSILFYKAAGWPVVPSCSCIVFWFTYVHIIVKQKVLVVFSPLVQASCRCVLHVGRSYKRVLTL